MAQGSKTKKTISTSDLVGKKVKTIPTPAPEIGQADPTGFMLTLIDAAQSGKIDLASLGSFETRAQTREQLYEFIDTMAQDDIISSVIETYAENVVETNDKGQSVWCESSDSNIAQYVSFLLDSLNVDKNIYTWACSLLSYGDLYLRLYKESDYGEDPIFNPQVLQKDRTLNESLNENVNLKIYGANDHYVPYVEAVANPGEMFELTKFGKTVGYVYAPTRVVQQTTDNFYTYLTKYQMKKKDVEVYDSTSFVHACLEDTLVRQPETIDLFLEDPTDPTKEVSASYKVKRGQSILYNSFRIWRELTLLENSALLNRLTKSAVVRILNVDIGDMPKEQVNAFMSRLKEKIEQKTAIETGKGLSEYTNPGPIENTIYIPVHGTQGTITATTIGGDYDPKSLVDLEYFRDKLFGSLKVPKQFFGFTGDGAGFDGGKALTVLSSRYGKSIKRIQNTLCQTITDLINLYLIDRGLENYINKFTIRMQPPLTQEELDRRANNDTRMRYVNDVMSQLEGIEDATIKLKILKALLSNIVGDPEVIGLMQEYINQLEAEKKSKESPEEESTEETEESSNEELPPMSPSEELPPVEEAVNNEDEPVVLMEEGTEEQAEDDSYIPSPAELGLDLASDK